MSGEWFSASELAACALPDMPTTRGNVLDLARRKGWLEPSLEGHAWRTRAARGGGVEFHVSVLWAPAQAALALHRTVAADGVAQTKDERPARKREIDREGLYEWFEGLPAAKKAAAAERLRALDAVAILRRAGASRTIAIAEVGASCGVAPSTLYAWEAMVLGVPRADWLPLLAPKHSGGQGRATCAADAWDMLRADWLRPERPTFEACFRRLEKVAREQGWTLPSARTLRRRIEAIPQSVAMLAR